ncbi:hypothetical protein [Pseudomonas sp. RIT-PI-S]|uniref:hypothetical protein n=1 Tax=Pseudomonas sp. RIT-PI-S TaxID=3035295 RepID=UPI0021DAA64F|nr:hypothetical protein [Pseudomonas sp. RIT-PI-S]
MGNVGDALEMTLSRPTRDDRKWLQVSLLRAQLLSVRFGCDIYARAVSGRHWISSDGVDLLIGPGERVKLPPGLALIDGEGILQLAPAKAKEPRQPLSWLFSDMYKRRPAVLEINID